MLSSGAESDVTETWWSFACQFGYNTDLDGEYNTTSHIHPASHLPLFSYVLKPSRKSDQKARFQTRMERAEFEDDESTDGDSEYNELDDFEEKYWWEEDESEDLDCERDVEEHEYTTFGDTARTVKIQLFLTNEEDEEMDKSRWMTNFVAQCTCDSVVVATTLAQYIH
ncbi:hypothetical protein CNMCM6805_005161 [Aspergillus fumigatiaffinis]|uniref:Uncharacterized protein n=1 Tax=Aspergillus fumigatiaffinis TaxID=340414 RepID=A0A8H4GPW3_9EURO|nr:hypothetical protein CNMCM6805_005161 [Aspergillus fumigatiaffinis]